MDTATKTGIDSAKAASDLCDYSDAYIVVKGDVTVEGENSRVEKNRPLAFKNNAPFISCIAKINGVLI